MMNVGAQCNVLTVAGELKNCLEVIGTKERFEANRIIFSEDSDNAGVFLLLTGKVRMTVKGLPKLDRLFSGGSLLGLPSTFTGRPYSLTAETLIDSVVVHVMADGFVQLMRERPDLCSEATQILGREVTFIQSALAQRRKQLASRERSSTAVA